MTTPGTPGMENPVSAMSEFVSATSYQMLGLRTGRCGSPASSGLPLFVFDPPSAQQLDPSPSIATHPS